MESTRGRRKWRQRQPKIIGGEYVAKSAPDGYTLLERTRRRS